MLARLVCCCCDAEFLVGDVIQAEVNSMVSSEVRSLKGRKRGSAPLVVCAVPMSLERWRAYCILC